MDFNFHSDPLVNRDDPIPVVAISAPRDDPSPVEQERPKGKRASIRQSLSTDRLKEKLDGFKGHAAAHGHQRSASTSASESPSKIHDRLMNMLLQQMIPAEDLDDAARPKDRRSRKYVERPGFSIPTMSYNFRRFNARIGVAFVFENRLIRLFSWKDPTHTLAFLAIYSFVCLDPNLLAVLPLAGCLFFVMVPAFLARHPPPPSHLPTDVHPLNGPPMAPPQNIKPAPEFSKDFLRNMRDLQNSMEDFSRVHDAAINFITPPTNFSDETLSSALYLILFLTSIILFIAAQILPWRAVFLVTGWVLVGACHPKAQSFLEDTHADEFLKEQGDHAVSWLHAFADGDIDLSHAPERREVEVFELQRRSSDAPDAEYEPFLFTTQPYTPLSPARIAGDRPRGSRFFEDVEPPKGWRWADKKWTLDLLSREWVEDRCITGVEVEIEGERWVSDIQYDDADFASLALASNEDITKTGVAAAGLALVGGGLASQSSPNLHASSGSPTIARPKRSFKSWEEGDGSRKKGQWRRRRWVRLVERRPLPPPEDLYLSAQN
ncbi:Integral peroxisomal membrane peroxin [Macrophomina phaseolina MS6]|uniref:Integral peroxisomal membrane peroxin n=1 Tax=Macrophomina phaseolina (strain MS6) TaxID=1126212 RepID=K2SUP6_MACPH|nr:Integral peroxisomal membrane peroxin [Macrophomina phaseolina MS6]